MHETRHALLEIAREARGDVRGDPATRELYAVDARGSAQAWTARHSLMPLSDARIEEIVAEVRAEMALQDQQRAAERLNGLRCTCCSKPLPKGHGGGECASCAAIPV